VRALGWSIGFSLTLLPSVPPSLAQRHTHAHTQDIYDNAKLGLLALRKNALFTAIDMDRLALDDPELTIQTTAEVFSLLAQGAYHPIPATVYTMDRIQEAVELMKAGKHTGKVVLSNYTPAGEPVPVRVRIPQRVFGPDGTYLITGAAGGFGSKVVRLAFEKGARHFLLTVTREPERCTALFRDIIATPGCTLEAVVADTASEADMAALVKRAAQGSATRPPLVAVFHVAGISMDTVLTEVKADDLLKVGACKALGAWYLHQATKELARVHTFCVISSVASLIGGRGRSAYSAANAFMDALIRHRHALGLPGTAFNMTSLCVRVIFCGWSFLLLFFLGGAYDPDHDQTITCSLSSSPFDQSPPPQHTARTWASWRTTSRSGRCSSVPTWSSCARRARCRTWRTRS
jgi:NAD(P)-dependent dehydrogenase (short-subunit alcohol dehydrogenase family)